MKQMLIKIFKLFARLQYAVTHNSSAIKRTNNLDSSFSHTGALIHDKNVQTATIQHDIDLPYKAFFASSIEQVTFSNEQVGSNVIEASAFAQCTQLTHIEIPTNYKSIGARAFSHCRRLEDVVLPENTAEIGEYAFECCDNLKHVNLPTDIEILRYGTFRKCHKLEELIVPANVKTIQYACFEECYKLRRILVPNGIDIDQDAFDMNTKTKIEYYEPCS